MTKESFAEDNKKRVKRFIKSLRFAKRNPIALKYIKLDMASTRVVGFSDAAFANNDDYSSQLGLIIIFADSDNIAVIISYISYKSRRVIRLILVAEVISFADLLDEGFA